MKLLPQFSRDFYMVCFSGILRPPGVTWCKKPEKSGIKEETRIFVSNCATPSPRTTEDKV